MEATTAVDEQKSIGSLYYKDFPDGRETIVPLGDQEGLLKVTKSGNFVKFRLRNSTSLTWINLTLASEIPSYSPKLFNQSFAWATIDEASGLDICMADNFEPRDADDLIFMYLATVFGSYI